MTAFNTLGQKLVTFVQETQDASYHEVKFDGSDLANGVYIYRLQAGSFVQTHTMLIVK